MLLRSFVALCVLLLAAPAFPGTIDVTQTYSGTASVDATFRFWNLDSGQGQTWSGSPNATLPFSLLFPALNLPSEAKLTSAVLDLEFADLSAPPFASTRTEVDHTYQQWQAVGGHQVWYSYSCGWGSTCWGSYWVTDYDWVTYWGYGGGATFTTPYSRSLSTITAGSTSHAASAGSIDLLANGFGPSLSGNNALTVDGVANLGVTPTVTSYGYHADTSYAVSSALPVGVSGKLSVDYVTPEPGSLFLLAPGLLGLWYKVRKRRAVHA